MTLLQDPESMTMDYVKLHCPVFEKGSACPYHVEGLKGLAKGCPEFKNGCPFKDVKDVAEFKGKLAEMRDFCVKGKDQYRKAFEVRNSSIVVLLTNYRPT